MLPDFPDIKAQLRGRLLRRAEMLIPQFSPILAEVRRFRQHEGRQSTLTRQDESKASMEYELASFGFELSREEMRSVDFPALLAKLDAMSEAMAKAQTQMMFARISTAVKAVGTEVETGGDFQKKHLLEMMERMETDFDPETNQPINQVLVMHPDSAATLLPRMKEWEADPEFVARVKEITEQKREEWRARENRRKLVD